MNHIYRFHIGAEFRVKRMGFENSYYTMTVSNIAIISDDDGTEVQVYMTVADQKYHHSPQEWHRLFTTTLSVEQIA